MPGSLLIDVSNNQGRDGLLAIQDNTVQAVYAKATESLSFTDGWYPLYREQARKLGKPFGGYLFLHPDQDGAAQARYFLTYAKPKPGDLEPVVDSELLGRGGWRQAAQTTLAALDELATHGYQPLLYGSTSFLTDLVAAQPGLRRFRVWQAEYGPRLHRVPGLNAVAWQFTDAQTVAKGRLRVDGDRLLTRNLDALRIPADAVVSHPVTKKPRPKTAPRPRRKYFTRKRDAQAACGPGQSVHFKEGRGYYAGPGKPSSGGGRPPKAA